MSYMDEVNYCKTHPAQISRVRGTVTPNGRFTIEATCFGETTVVSARRFLGDWIPPAHDLRY